MNTSLRTAIDVYFRGERAEMIAFLAFGIVLVVATVLLWASHDRFARALAVSLGLVAIVAFSVAVPLLLRDGPHAERLRERLERGEEAGVRTDEGARMAVVNHNYAYYRYLYAVCLAVAALLMLFWRTPITSGVAVGLMIFAATGLVVDHYSESRAAIYAEALQG